MKNKVETALELRDKILFRIVEQETSALYWEEVSKKAKANTPEKLESMKKILANNNLVKKDNLYLKVIDKYIKDING